jgi:cytochrome c oxidase cbb3-type subunit IV
MNINDIRSAVTLLSLLVFLGIVWWAWRASNKADFDRAAHLPLDQE